MAVARSIRFVGVAAVILCLWLILQVFRSEGGGGGQNMGKIPKMEKDPLLDGMSRAGFTAYSRD